MAAVLDNTLDYKDSGRDRGMPWWANFRSFEGDNRSEEFYTLPFDLNRFFPRHRSPSTQQQLVSCNLSLLQALSNNVCKSDFARTLNQCSNAVKVTPKSKE
ncbi:hypothetical protein V6N13_084430 [Hibiscus sabdariffa]